MKEISPPAIVREASNLAALAQQINAADEACARYKRLSEDKGQERVLLLRQAKELCVQEGMSWHEWIEAHLTLSVRRCQELIRDESCPVRAESARTGQQQEEMRGEEQAAELEPREEEEAKPVPSEPIAVPGRKTKPCSACNGSGFQYEEEPKAPPAPKPTQEKPVSEKQAMRAARAAFKPPVTSWGSVQPFFWPGERCGHCGRGEPSRGCPACWEKAQKNAEKEQG